MNRGNFFKVDNNSKHQKGLVYYRYLPFMRLKLQGNESDYPIYICISKTSITFNIQIRNVESKPENSIDNLFVHNYQHTELFSLPLMLNLRSRENLVSIMEDVYYGTQHFSSDYKLLDDYCNFPSYKIEVFGSEKDETPKYTISFRQLFLDFLFDLEHSSVFKNSPAYEVMEESLREDDFFTALSAKAEFYYLLNDHVKYLFKEKNQHSTILQFKTKTLITAAKSWLNNIRKANTEELFIQSEWFDSIIEKEYRQVIFSEKYAQKTSLFTFRKTLFNYIKQSRKQIEKLSGQERTPVNKKQNNEKNKTKAPICTKQIYREHREHIKRIRKESNKWFIRRYNLISAFRCKIFSLNNLLPRLIMATSSAWLLFITTEEIWKTTIDTRVQTSLWILFLIAIIVLFLSNEIKSLTRLKTRWHNFFRAFSILIFGYIFSLVIGLFFTWNTAEKMIVRGDFLKELFIEKIEGNAFRNDKSLETIFQAIVKDKDKISDRLKMKNYLIEDLESKDSKISDKKLYALLTEVKAHKNALLPIKSEVVIFGRQNLFPNLLFYRSLLALFIGLFLQLVFEDKPVTEPI